MIKIAVVDFLYSHPFTIHIFQVLIMAQKYFRILHFAQFFDECLFVGGNRKKFSDNLFSLKYFFWKEKNAAISTLCKRWCVPYNLTGVFCRLSKIYLLLVYSGVFFANQ